MFNQSKGRYTGLQMEKVKAFKPTKNSILVIKKQVVHEIIEQTGGDSWNAVAREQDGGGTQFIYRGTNETKVQGEHKWQETLHKKTRDKQTTK